MRLDVLGLKRTEMFAIGRGSSISSTGCERWVGSLESCFELIAVPPLQPESRLHEVPLGCSRAAFPVPQGDPAPHEAALGPPRAPESADVATWHGPSLP